MTMSQRLQAAGVERNVVVDQRAEDIEDGGLGDRRRGVEVARLLRRGAGEVDRRRTALGIDANGHSDHRAVVHLVGERTVLEHVDDAAHLLLGVVLDVAHVGVHHVEAEVRHHLAQLLRALLVGGDLGAEIGQVLRDVAGRIASGGEQLAQLAFAEPAALDQQHVVDQHAFFVDAAAVGRHRAGGDAADVGVMAARADEEQDVSCRASSNTGVITVMSGRCVPPL